MDGFHLVLLRRTISRRAAFDHVRDINLFALHADKLNHLVEELAGAADERQPLFVFIRAGAFADEQQLGVR